MKRRIGTIFLALALCLTLLPVSAFAASTTPKITAIGENEKQSISTSQSGSGWLLFQKRSFCLLQRLIRLQRHV